MIASDARIIEAIKALTKKRGYPPSIRELCDEVGLRSPGSMKYRLERLRQSGKVTFDRGIPRSLRVTGGGK